VTVKSNVTFYDGVARWN